MTKNTETLYVIVRHDEDDGIQSPYYFVETEAEAIEAVKKLNTEDGLHVTLEDDGSVADITDDDAIWYEYFDVTRYKKEA